MDGEWKRLAAVAMALAAVATTLGVRAAALSLRPHLRPPVVSEVRSGAPNSINPLRAHNPTARWLDGLMFDSLTQFKRGRLWPRLADHWQASHHEKTWHIQLNPRAKWWNGRPISARDVVWSYRLKLRQWPKQPLASLRPQFSINGTLALGVTLDRPDARFMRQFTSTGPVSWILPAFLLTKLKPKVLMTTPYLDDPVDIVGSGPYRLLSLNAHSARLQANMHYFLGIAKPEGILVHFSGQHG